MHILVQWPARVLPVDSPSWLFFQELIIYYISWISPSPRRQRFICQRPSPPTSLTPRWHPSSPTPHYISENHHPFRNDGAQHPQTRAATPPHIHRGNTETVQRRKRPTAPAPTVKRPTSLATTVRPPSLSPTSAHTIHSSSLSALYKARHGW